MAITQVYTAVPNDVITAARWNNEFGNIYNNGTSLAFPVTTAVSFAGYSLTLDAAGSTTLSSSARTGLILVAGNKSGIPSAAVGYVARVEGTTFTDTQTAGSGTATSMSGTSFSRPTIASTNSSVITTDSATVYVENSPVAGTNQTLTNAWSLWVDAGNVRLDGELRVDGALRGIVALADHIYGLTWAPAADATNDFTYAIGGAVSDDAAATSKRMMTQTAILVKRADATFVVGTNQGMLDTGAVADSPYFVYLIMRPDTGVVDYLSSLSSTAPTMPANYTYKRLIGWFLRVAGVNVLHHVYELSGGGIHFLWDSPTLDVDLAATLTTTLRTDAAKVPIFGAGEASVLAQFNVSAEDASSASCIYMLCPDLTDLTPAVTVAPLATLKSQVANVEVEAQVEVRTSAGFGTVAAKANVSTYDNYAFATIGFKWSRR